MKVNLQSRVKGKRLIAGLRPADEVKDVLEGWSKQGKDLCTHCSATGPSLQPAVNVSSLSPD